jgi:hypothetical protein
MQSITTNKIALITALDAAGWGFSSFAGQVFSPNGAGGMQFTVYPSPKQATPAIATGTQKKALIDAFPAYNVSLADAQVFDDADNVTVPGLTVTLSPIPAAPAAAGSAA